MKLDYLIFADNLATAILAFVVVASLAVLIRLRNEK